MQYNVQGNCLVLYISDDLDHYMVTKLREETDRLIEQERIKHIIFDFSGVGFMDSSGIGLIMGRYKKVMFIGGKAGVTNVGKAVDRIFQLSGLYHIIEKFNTIPEAIGAFQGKTGKENKERL